MREMLLPPRFSFAYEFCVQKHSVAQLLSPGRGSWTGLGKQIDGADEIVGQSPRFELYGGWLTIFPSRKRTLSFSDPAADSASYQPRKWTGASYREFIREYIREYIRKTDHEFRKNDESDGYKPDPAMTEPVQQQGQVPNWVSYSLLVGEGLEKVLRLGDKLRFSHHRANISYAVLRDSVRVFSAGAVGSGDDGGAFAAWDTIEVRPGFEQRPRSGDPGVIDSVDKVLQAIKEFHDAHHQYVSVRIGDRLFRLERRQGVRLDPYYVFVARLRSLAQSPGKDQERSIHAGGRLDSPGLGLIQDAADCLIAPKINLESRHESSPF